MKWLLLFAVGSLLAVSIAAWAQMVSMWIAAAYLGGSLLAVIAYARDKRKATRGEWRTAESSLHLLELIGGWPGALIAQQTLRHKTRKVSFQITFWMIVATHLGVWIWFALR